MLITATLPPSLGVTTQAITATDVSGIAVTLISSRTIVACPACGALATRVHSRYPRTLADLPWQGLAVSLVLQVRRFFCDRAACPRRIFAERFPGLAAPHGRRSARLTTLFQAIGVALGGEGGARLVADLGLTTSPDTLLRLVRALPLPVDVMPRVLGVDDFARRRGRTYGTILVDLERHCVVDLLRDRTADTLATWLAAHPGVAIISRDRASAYADGARQGAPDAVQVADRWHLLKNVGDALERFLLGQAAALRRARIDVSCDRAAGAGAVPAPDAPEATTEAPQDPVAAPPKPGTTRRQARYAAVVALRAEGQTIRAIARQTGLSRMTTRKYLRASGCPGPPARSGMLTTGSGWEQRLREHWNGGEHNAAALWRVVRAEGFPGSAGSIRRHVGAWRTVRGRPGRTPTDRPGNLDTGPAPPPPPSPRQVRWWLLRPADELTSDQTAYLERLRTACPATHTAQLVAQEFGRIVQERDRAAYDRWLEVAEGCGVAELSGVATFMRRDYAAIVAALTLPWSNGQTEGQVTRLKLVKRLMYGRGNLDLLYRRLMPTA
jgi:transposase/DNA-binding CsgD family transcriptional regulator